MSTLRGLAVRWRWICVVAFGALVGGGLMTLSPWAVFGPVVPAVEDTASSGQLLVYLLALWGVGFLTVGTVPVGGPKGEQQIGQFVASFLGRLTLLIVAVLWVDLQITRIAEVEKVPGKCSELRGSEQLAACGEGIQSSGAPGTEEGSESHLGVGALG